MQVTSVLTPAEERGKIAFNPETSITSEGEKVELCFEAFPIEVTGTPLFTYFDVTAHA